MRRLTTLAIAVAACVSLLVGAAIANPPGKSAPKREKTGMAMTLKQPPKTVKTVKKGKGVAVKHTSSTAKKIVTKKTLSAKRAVKAPATKTTKTVARPKAVSKVQAK
jgi:hypothetical protein